MVQLTCSFHLIAWYGITDGTLVCAPLMLLLQFMYFFLC